MIDDSTLSLIKWHEEQVSFWEKCLEKHESGEHKVYSLIAIKDKIKYNKDMVIKLKNQLLNK